jgi:dihydropteroate synthase
VASGLPVILMHMQGDPGTMQDNPQYEDAAQDVFDYLKQRVAECEAAGMDRSRIAIDPGIGFGKTLDHNLDILARLNLYRDFKCPVLLGVSRKTFIGKLGGDAAPKERLGGSLAAVLAAAARGVRLFRVHDVAETRQALTIWQAIEKK